LIEIEAYRFHQPDVPGDVAAIATAIPPHNPDQPEREVPDIGWSLAIQIEFVELAVARLEAEVATR
jgi:hypothetical protein